MMKSLLLAAATCLGACSFIFAADQDSRANWGTLRTPAFAEMPGQFRQPNRIYAPFMFWFWDEPLDAAKMAEMSRVMCSQGGNPGYAHARMSMVGTPNLPGEQWIGDRWFDAFSAALKQAESHGCYLGYCDEYWWPSFQANGRILQKHPDLQAVSLQWGVIDAAGGTEVAVPESFFAVAAKLANPSTSMASVPVFPGKWIWDQQGGETKHTCWFRKTFKLPKKHKAVRAVIRLTADNGYTLFVNGRKIGAADNWYEVGQYDVTDAVTAGENMLAIEGRNVDGPCGLLVAMTVVLDNGTIISVASDGSWRTTLKQADGWEKAGFDDGEWTKAREICEVGQGPWGAIASMEPAYTHATIRSGSLRVIGGGKPFSWKAPEGASWRVYTFRKYFHPGIDGGKTNSIDSRLAKAFIDVALEPYARRMGDRMGKSIPGDFIDNEGDYGWQLAWSDTLDRDYQKRYGRDIRLWMPLMLDKDAEGQYAKARWEWFDLVSDIYTAQFRAVTDWHERRGMYTTAHVWEETLTAQVNAVGDHLKFLRSLTMPAQDCLWDKCFYIHDFKEIASVAEFQGTRAATELMGVAGWAGLEPEFLKRSVNAVTAWGMSHIIPHGLFTSRRLDGNPWMPDFYADSPTFPWMHLWNDFTARASYVNSLGHAVPDVLLYNPLESAWTLASADMFDKDMWLYSERTAEGKQINMIDRNYAKAMQDLTAGRVEFLVGDRFFMSQMSVKDGRLVRGPMSFGTLVLPPIRIVSLATARKMLDFAKSGGHVFALGELPSGSAENGMNDAKMKTLMQTLAAQPTFKQCAAEPADAVAEWRDNSGWQYKSDASGFGLRPLIAERAAGLESPVRFVSGQFPMLQTRRRIDGRDFFWFANNDTSRPQQCEVDVAGVHGAVSIWDCETGEVRPAASGDEGSGSRVSLSFKPLEAYWVVFDPQRPAEATVPAQPEAKVVTTVAGPWMLRYDASIQPKMEHAVVPPAEFASGVRRPLGDWQGLGLKGFSGLLDYTATLTVVEPAGRMLLDLGEVHSAAEVWVNGQSCGKRLWGPYVFDVSSVLKSGENQIKIRIANSLGVSYGLQMKQGLYGPVQLRQAKP
jgi:hypothetical protein